MPCTPEEMAELAKLLADGKLGETKALSVDLPEPEQIPGRNEANKKMGIFANLRTARAALGDYLGINAVDPTAQTLIKSENFKHEFHERLYEALEPLMEKSKWKRLIWGGIPEETDKQIGMALEWVDRGGKYTGKPGQFTQEVIDAAKRVRPIYDELFDKSGMDGDQYLRGYRPLLRQRPNGIMWPRPDETEAERVFKAQIRPRDVEFYHSYERKGTMLDPDVRVTTTFNEYLNGFAKAYILAPELERIEKTVVNPHFGFQMYATPEGRMLPMADDAVGYKAWTEFASHVLGAHTPYDVAATNSLKNFLGMFGQTADERSLYKISQTLQSLQYSGALGVPFLGGRPGSIIRQATQIVPTWAQMGTKHTMAGIQKAMSKDAEGNWMNKQLIDRNMLSSPLERLVDTVDIQRGIGRTISAISEDSLKVFSAVDRFTRAATAWAAESKFNEYQARNMLDRLPMRKELKDEVLRLAESGNIEGARDRYMFTQVADLQYTYGKANRPAAFRGALGNLLGVFMAYPLNTAEMTRLFAKQAMEGDWQPLARLIAANTMIGIVGSEMLGADVRSATIYSLMPHSMTFPKTALDMYSVGLSNYEWLTGKLFAGGESDFNKHKRIENNAALVRDASSLVPGGVFAFQDLPKMIDRGSAARAFALMPKTQEVNAYAHQKAAEAAAARSQTTSGYSTFRPYQ